MIAFLFHSTVSSKGYVFGGGSVIAIRQIQEVLLPDRLQLATNDLGQSNHSWALSSMIKGIGSLTPLLLNNLAPTLILWDH